MTDSPEQRLLYSDAAPPWRRAIDALLCRARAGGYRKSDRDTVALYPSVAQPWLTFPLKTEAARYAESHLLPPPLAGTRARAVQGIARFMLGCDARIGAIIARGKSREWEQVRVWVNGKLTDSPAQATSALEIHTTRPVLLLFDDGEQPLWSVRFGSEAETRRECEILQILHDADRALVPEPLLCQQYIDGRWIAVQRGIEGLPWFRFLPMMAGRLDAPRIAVMLATLERLHRAIERNLAWGREFRLIEELQTWTARARERGVLPVGSEIPFRGMTQFATRWFPQHGDFSPNNLILRDDSATIIDFEEFDTTAAPLCDECSLAFSLAPLVPDTSEYELLRRCVSATLARHPDITPHVFGLVLLHLLVRLVACADRRNRTPMIGGLQHRLSTILATGREAFMSI